MKVKLTTFLIWMYFFNMIVVPNGTAFSRILKILFVGLAGLYIILNRYRTKWYGHFNWLILFTAISAASILWATSRDFAMRGAGTIALNSICVIMLGLVLLCANDWIGVTVPCLCILPIIFFARLFILHGTAVLGGLRNVEGGMHNTVGVYSGFGMSFCIYYIMDRGRKNKNVTARWIVLCAINTLICVVSMSRKIIVYLFLPLFLGVLLSGENYTKRIRNLLTIALGTTVVYFALMNIPVLYNYIGKGIEKVITYLTRGTGDASAAGRNTRIQYGLLMFSRKPWFGYGAMNYNYLFYNFESLTQMIVADNNFVDIAVNSGIVGLAAYYSIYLKYTFLYLKKGKHDTFVHVFPFAILLTLLITDYGVSAYLYQHSQTYLMIATLMIFQQTEVSSLRKETNLV